MFSTALSVAVVVVSSTPKGDPSWWPRNLGHDGCFIMPHEGMNGQCDMSRASAHLTVLPNLRVGLPTALDLLDQGSEGLYGAWVDERQTSPWAELLLSTKTQIPKACDMRRKTPKRDLKQPINNNIYVTVDKRHHMKKLTLFCWKCCMLVWWRVGFPLLSPEGSPRGGTQSAPLQGDQIRCPQRRRWTPRSLSRHWHWFDRGSKPQSWTRPQRCCHLWTCLNSRLRWLYASAAYKNGEYYTFRKSKYM